MLTDPTLLMCCRRAPNGIKFVSGPSVEVRFRSPDGLERLLEARSTPRAPEGTGVYRDEFTFDARHWKGQAKFSGTTTSRCVPATAVAPVPGDAAPRAASPTTTNSLGVNPICTRKPPCPLHTVSLSDVIGAGKPVAVLFATPALCTSQFCGRCSTRCST
jgi:hypothetical protein